MIDSTGIQAQRSASGGSAELREELEQLGTGPVIPNRNNRKQPFRFSKHLYKPRWRIEAAVKCGENEVIWVRLAKRSTPTPPASDLR